MIVVLDVRIAVGEEVFSLVVALIVSHATSICRVSRGAPAPRTAITPIISKFQTAYAIFELLVKVDLLTELEQVGLSRWWVASQCQQKDNCNDEAPVFHRVSAK